MRCVAHRRAGRSPPRPLRGLRPWPGRPAGRTGTSPERPVFEPESRLAAPVSADSSLHAGRRPAALTEVARRGYRRQLGSIGRVANSSGSGWRQRPGHQGPIGRQLGARLGGYFMAVRGEGVCDALVDPVGPGTGRAGAAHRPHAPPRRVAPRTEQGTGTTMRRREPYEPGSNDGVDPRGCSHVWRDRAVTAVLGDCMAQVCDRCGALHIEGADEPSEQHSPKHGAGLSRMPARLTWSHFRDDGQPVKPHPLRTSGPTRLDIRHLRHFLGRVTNANRVGCGWAQARPAKVHRWGFAIPVNRA